MNPTVLWAYKVCSSVLDFSIEARKNAACVQQPLVIMALRWPTSLVIVACWGKYWCAHLLHIQTLTDVELLDHHRPQTQSSFIFEEGQTGLYSVVSPPCSVWWIRLHSHRSWSCWMQIPSSGSTTGEHNGESGGARERPDSWHRSIEWMRTAERTSERARGREREKERGGVFISTSEVVISVMNWSYGISTIFIAS